MSSTSLKSPGQALQDYLNACELALGWFRKGKYSWAELLDLQAQAARRLNGQLADHFLARAHNSEALRSEGQQAAPAPDTARSCLTDRGTR